jgi:hypothetical protein
MKRRFKRFECGALFAALFYYFYFVSRAAASVDRKVLSRPATATTRIVAYNLGNDTSRLFKRK